MRPIIKDYNEEEINYFSLINPRKRKVWNITSLYKLQLELEKRRNDRIKQKSEVIKEIVEKIIPEKRGVDKDINSWVVHKKHESNGTITYYKVRIEWSNEWECYTTSYGGERVGDNKDVISNREEGINEIIQGDLQKELGEKYDKYNKLASSKFLHLVENYLWKAIEKELKEREIGKKYSIFTITISGDQYYVTTDYEKYPYILKYKLGDKVNNINIEF